MRDDLLDAQAVIEWAKSQLPILEANIKAWFKSGSYTVSRDFDPQRGKDCIKVRAITPPRQINAEVGVIVHALRSSLDILAIALARRNGATVLEDVYFPVSTDITAFQAKDGGRKKIKRLTAPDVMKIEGLKPYGGGNDLLFALHKMDVTRKHQRLISLRFTPETTTFYEWGKLGEHEFSGWSNLKEQATLWVSPEADCNVDITPAITIAEAYTIPSKPALDTLSDFVSLTQSIINLFDT